MNAVNKLILLQSIAKSFFLRQALLHIPSLSFFLHHNIATRIRLPMYQGTWPRRLTAFTTHSVATVTTSGQNNAVKVLCILSISHFLFK